MGEQCRLATVHIDRQEVVGTALSSSGCDISLHVTYQPHWNPPYKEKIIPLPYPYQQDISYSS
jgi:hypothetical protein